MVHVEGHADPEDEEWCRRPPAVYDSQHFSGSLQSLPDDVDSMACTFDRVYPRVSGFHTLPGSAGATAERYAPHFSQSSYPMTGGDPSIF